MITANPAIPVFAHFTDIANGYATATALRITVCILENLYLTCHRMI